MSELIKEFKLYYDNQNICFVYGCIKSFSYGEGSNLSYHATAEQREWQSVHLLIKEFKLYYGNQNTYFVYDCIKSFSHGESSNLSYDATAFLPLVTVCSVEKTTV